MVIRHEKGEKKFPCVKCGKSFCLEENFERHVKLHDLEEVKPLVCDMCDDRFEDEERLQKHLTTQTHVNQFKCHLCVITCRSKVHLERHLRNHTHPKEKTESCTHCDKKYRDKITLVRHIARVHSDGPAPHICHICGKGFHVPADLKVHVDRHEGKSLAKCDTCGETFASSGSLQSHLSEVKLIPELVYLQLCDVRFLRPGKLKDHMRSHSKERPFRCLQCEKGFKSKKNLDTHVTRVHTEGYVVPTPHKCPHCDKGFQYPFILEGHIRQVHMGERPFVCDQCGKRFALKIVGENTWNLVVVKESDRCEEGRLA
ncbi:myoneurin-like [Folsomia candida]|uniref:myoneurin-like n=1 Tax=Folsomia candida TaxID=158441 RepID=UPI000B8F03C7|nr:myoneurin-like [Folsomia candida]